MYQQLYCHICVPTAITIWYTHHNITARETADESERETKMKCIFFLWRLPFQLERALCILLCRFAFVLIYFVCVCIVRGIRIQFRAQKTNWLDSELVIFEWIWIDTAWRIMMLQKLFIFTNWFSTESNYFVMRNSKKVKWNKYAIRICSIGANNDDNGTWIKFHFV